MNHLSLAGSGYRRPVATGHPEDAAQNPHPDWRTVMVFHELIAPAENPALAAALAKARDDYGGLTPAEKVQLAFFSRATFRGIQNAFFQHRQGLLSESAWRDYEWIVRMNLRRPDVPEVAYGARLVRQ
jgi:hypothetical protein